MLFRLGLQFLEQLDPVTRAELDQLVSSIQAQSSFPVKVEDGGTGLNALEVKDGELLIGSALIGRFVLNRLTAGPGIAIHNGHGSITISAAIGAGMMLGAGIGNSPRRSVCIIRPDDAGAGW